MMKDVLATFFVYGTLKRGYANHGLLAPYVISSIPAWITGDLYRVQGFPMLCAGHGVVRGEVLSLRPGSMALALPLVDTLEDYRPDAPAQSLYLRRIVQATTTSGAKIRAYAYYFNDSCDSAADLGPLSLVSGGEWRDAPHNSPAADPATRR